jgi:hypothetical protein
MKAGVRDAVENIEGVTRSWFEWDLSRDGSSTNVLVVEVEWDTDPNGGGHRPFAMDTISETVAEFLDTKTTMGVHALRVVPKQRA